MPDSEPQLSSQPTLETGAQLGSYRVVRLIGSGGMADVFYAIHEGLERPAAVKVLRASLATSEIHLQRFMQEARAAASLVHPNIVQVYDVGTQNEYRYIAQEYIPGTNLRQYLSDHGEADSQDETNGRPLDRQLALREALSILLQILAALNKSASSGIVHRDIKPENIMLTQDGDVKVADFGLARVLLGDDPQLTRAGTTLGTPMYMSPEQIQEGQVDIRSDLYSLGVTLYHMLSGSPPFTGDTPLALAMKHVQQTVPDIRRARVDLPASLVEFLGKLLAKDPEHRFAHPSEALDFLRGHKSTDLAECWPDQTVPLPGAKLQSSGGPMEATLVLQSKLRKQGRGLKSKWVVRTGIAALLLLSFLGGAALTFERPFRLEAPEDSFKGIPKQATAKEQFHLALFRDDLDPVWKWEAIEEYFPDDQSDYPIQAKIKLAAAKQARGDYRDAEQILDPVAESRDTASLLRALAELQLAIGADDQELDDSAKRHTEAALEIVSRGDFSTGDRRILDGLVREMPNKIYQRWFGAKNAPAEAPPAD